MTLNKRQKEIVREVRNYFIDNPYEWWNTCEEYLSFMDRQVEVWRPMNALDSKLWVCPPMAIIKAIDGNFNCNDDYFRFIKGKLKSGTKPCYDDLLYSYSEMAEILYYGNVGKICFPEDIIGLAEEFENERQKEIAKAKARKED